VKTGTFVAVKRLKRIDLTQSQLEGLMTEVNLLEKFSHENIVKYLGLVTTENHLNLVLELVEGGSLAGILDAHGNFSEPLVAVYIKQVLAGLAYLHKGGVVHRDIKGPNILITKEGVVKLADFGIAMNESLAAEGDCLGSPYWMAPEIIERVPSACPTACDIWSLGCTIIELLTGAPPYADMIAFSAMFRMVQEKHPPLPDDISPALEDFLLKCFRRDPTERPTAAELLKHPWILQHEKEKTDNAKTQTAMVQQQQHITRTPEVPPKSPTLTNSQDEFETSLSQELGRKQIISFLTSSTAFPGDTPSFLNGLPLSCYVLLKFLNYWAEFKSQSFNLLTYVISSYTGLITDNRVSNPTLSFCLSCTSLLLRLTTQKLKSEKLANHSVEDQLKILVLDSTKEFPVEKLQYMQLDEEKMQKMEMVFCEDLRLLVSTVYGFLLGNVYDALKVAVVGLLNQSLSGDNKPSGIHTGGSLRKANSGSNIMSNDGIASLLKGVTSLLDELLTSFQTNFVHSELSKTFFEQVFYYLNCLLFNDLITRQERCTRDTALELQAAINYLQQWIEKTGPEWFGSSINEFNYLKQAVELLLDSNKTNLTDENTRKQLYPHLNAWQIKQLLTYYQPSSGSNEKKVPFNVISAITDSRVNSENSFILVFDKEATRPLSLDKLHYLNWSDLHSLPFRPLLKRQLFSSWITYSTSQLQEHKSQPSSLSLSRLWDPAIEFGCSELQYVLTLDSFSLKD
jgi:serine/threonine protein kinase